MRYRLIDVESGEVEEIEATSVTDAKDQAREWAIDAYGNGETGKTFWVDVLIERVEQTRIEWSPDESEEDRRFGRINPESLTIVVDPEEPPCLKNRKHKWIELSLSSHGGGVIISEICLHCKTVRTTDTWATRPDTGEEGLRSVSYVVEDDT